MEERRGIREDRIEEKVEEGEGDKRVMMEEGQRGRSVNGVM